MIKNRKRALLLYCCILLALFIVGLIYYKVDPESSQLFPKCPILVMTGWKCPGCGSQRTIHALLHLNIAAAFAYNALLVISIPYIVMLLYAQTRRFLFGETLRFFKSDHPAMPWLISFAILLFAITRNIFNF